MAVICPLDCGALSLLSVPEDYHYIRFYTIISRHDSTSRKFTKMEKYIAITNIFFQHIYRDVLLKDTLIFNNAVETGHMHSYLYMVNHMHVRVCVYLCLCEGWLTPSCELITTSVAFSTACI